MTTVRASLTYVLQGNARPCGNVYNQHFSCCSRENCAELSATYNFTTVLAHCDPIVSLLSCTLNVCFHEANKEKKQKHLPAAEMRTKAEKKERWVLFWLHSDVVDNAVRFSGSLCASHCTDNHMKLSLPPFLCHFTSPEFLNLPLFFNSPLRLPSIVFPFYCTHSHSSPLLHAFIVIYLYLKAVMLSLFSSSTHIPLPLSYYLSSPTLFYLPPSSEARLWGDSNHSVLWTKLLQHTQKRSWMPTQPYHSR